MSAPGTANASSSRRSALRSRPSARSACRSAARSRLTPIESSPRARCGGVRSRPRRRAASARVPPTWRGGPTSTNGWSRSGARRCSPGWAPRGKAGPFDRRDQPAAADDHRHVGPRDAVEDVALAEEACNDRDLLGRGTGRHGDDGVLGGLRVVDRWRGRAMDAGAAVPMRSRDAGRSVRAGPVADGAP